MLDFWHHYLTHGWNAIRQLLALAVFVPFFRRREHFFQRLAPVMGFYFALVAGLALLQLLYPDSDGVYAFSYMLMAWYALFLLIFCYEGKPASYVFHFFSAAILSSCVAAVRGCFLLLYKVDPVRFSLLEPDGAVDVLITVFIMATLYSGMYFAFSKRFQQYRRLEPSVSLVVPYSACPIVLLVLNMGEAAVENEGLLFWAYMMYLIIILYGFTILYIQYIVFIGKLYELQGEVERTEKLAIERLSRETTELYNTLKENMDTINIKCHDLKHRLAAGFGGRNDSWTQELIQSIDIYDRTIKTGNDHLDMVLMHHQLFFHSNQIRFSCVADGTKLGFMDLSDIYTLFGNALSNAGEYLVTVDEDKRLIRMWIREERSFLVIHVENYFEGRLELKDGLPQTAKDDKANHGFGTRSMKIVAEKYGGALDISVEGDLLCLNIMIPMQGQESIGTV